MKGEDGAVLILALVWILAVSLIVGAIATWATNDLNNTTQFRTARSMHYAATGAVEAAIHSMRYNPLIGTSPNTPLTLNANPPYYCWGSSPSILTTDNISIAVWCSTVENLASQDTRDVRFYACLSSVTSSSCQANPMLFADVAFDDYPGVQRTTTCSGPPPTGTCGQRSTLEDWLWNSSTPIPTTTSTTSTTSTTTTSTTTTSTTSTTTTTIQTTGSYSGASNGNMSNGSNYYSINATSNGSSTPTANTFTPGVAETLTGLTFTMNSSSPTTHSATVGLVNGSNWTSTSLSCSVTGGSGKTVCSSTGSVTIPVGDSINILGVGNGYHSGSWVVTYTQP